MRKSMKNICEKLPNLSCIIFLVKLVIWNGLKRVLEILRKVLCCPVERSWKEVSAAGAVAWFMPPLRCPSKGRKEASWKFPRRKSGAGALAACRCLFLAWDQPGQEKGAHACVRRLLLWSISLRSLTSVRLYDWHRGRLLCTQACKIANAWEHRCLLGLSSVAERVCLCCSRS